MTVVRVKGFQIFKDRHGRLRCYHRRTKQPIDLTKVPLGSPEFFAECARISAVATATEPKPGTLGMLIAAYRAHRAFTALDPCRADGASCTTGVDCCKGLCTNGTCGGPPRCSNVDEACMTSKDCCDPTAQCINGFCEMPVVK